ncbi:MAG: hypothetical protein BGO09_00990 [Bacteroidetes bacterium 47-18]|nr:MAG: hypothetical protein BGO09_00990 [Bacteroidetes bacterium 47-18]
MILVITPEQEADNEAVLAGEMLAAGAALLHIRKFRLDDAALRNYIETIDVAYRDRLVLHDHFHLARELGISRLHFREEDRRKGRYRPFREEYLLSTSVHTIEAFNQLGTEWTYAFLSPVFPSISKPGYGKDTRVLQDLGKRNNLMVQLIGLGGIDTTNFKQVLDAGADGVALLGGIWQAPDPLNILQQCLKSGL